MSKRNRLFLFSLAGGILSVSLFATSSMASGPLVLSPSISTAPKVMTSTSVSQSNYYAKMLKAYRNMRTFWISRAIVR